MWAVFVVEQHEQKIDGLSLDIVGFVPTFFGLVLSFPHPHPSLGWGDEQRVAAKQVEVLRKARKRGGKA